MSPKEFRAMLRAEKEKEEVAGVLGCAVDSLDGHPFRAERYFDKGVTTWRINWQGRPPKGVKVEADGRSEIVITGRYEAPLEKYGLRRLSDDQIAAINDKINAVAANPDDPCQVCGGTHGIFPYLVRDSYGIDGAGFIGAIWAAITICEQCGFIRRFFQPDGGLKEQPNG